VPIQETANSSVSPVETNPMNQNIGNNKRQSDSNDFDDSDEPRIIKTIPGSQRTATGTTFTINNGPG
jgi:hypothetical protein